MDMDYRITENPPWWQRHPEKTTSELLTDINIFRKRFQNLVHESSTEEILRENDHFRQAMTVDFVFNLNIGELVGTQNVDDTRLLLEEINTQGNEQMKHDTDIINSSLGLDTVIERERLETMNTYSAMEMLAKKVAKEMEGTGLLTVQRVCDVHKILLQGLHPNNGNIRDSSVYTQYNGEYHFYPPPHIAQMRFYALIDRHNIFINQLDVTSEDYVLDMFKCAARLLFEFVDAHPFNDGNGRMCRLLANHVLSHITPFPVPLYHANHPNQCSRDQYINAIVKCRNNPDNGPGDLAAMLIDGAWIGWNCLFEKHLYLYTP